MVGRNCYFDFTSNKWEIWANEVEIIKVWLYNKK
mgnify:CR=1 FL=1